MTTRAEQFADEAHAWLATAPRISWTRDRNLRWFRGNVRGVQVAVINETLDPHTKEYSGQYRTHLDVDTGGGAPVFADSEEEAKAIAEHALAVFGALVFDLPAPPPLSAVRAAARGETTPTQAPACRCAVTHSE